MLACPPGGLTRLGLNKALGLCRATLLWKDKQSKAELNQDLVTMSRRGLFWKVKKKTPPLMQVRWGDEPRPTLAVPEVTGLPPGVIFHADNLEDVASFEGYCSLLARDGGILVGIIVEQSPHEQLKQEMHHIFLAFKQTNWWQRKVNTHSF